MWILYSNLCVRIKRYCLLLILKAIAISRDAIVVLILAAQNNRPSRAQAQFRTQWAQSKGLLQNSQQSSLVHPKHRVLVPPKLGPSKGLLVKFSTLCNYYLEILGGTTLSFSACSEWYCHQYLYRDCEKLE